MSDAQLRFFALETIEVQYPENDWLSVFIDASVFDRTHGIRSSAHCELFNFYLQ